MNVTINCSVITYDDLPDKYKDKLYHQEFEALRELWDFDSLVGEFKTQLADIGFTDAQVWFSGFGNQGDGACFDAFIDLIKVCNFLGIEYDPDKDIWDCQIVITDQRYNHERTRKIVLDVVTPGLIGAALQNDVEEQIEKLRLNLCKNFYRVLEEDAAGQTSRENILESLRSRHYSFRKDLESAIANMSNCGQVQII